MAEFSTALVDVRYVASADGAAAAFNGRCVCLQQQHTQTQHKARERPNLNNHLHGTYDHVHCMHQIGGLSILMAPTPQKESTSFMAKVLSAGNFGLG